MDTKELRYNLQNDIKRNISVHNTFAQRVGDTLVQLAIGATAIGLVVHFLPLILK